jgi:hypothetical protein
VDRPPVSCCGTRRMSSVTVHLRPSPTAATRSGRWICLRQRSHRSPSRTQKLSSCTPTILGGRLPGKIGNANTNLQLRLEVFFYPYEDTDACKCPPDTCHGMTILGLPGKIGNANTDLHRNVEVFFYISIYILF